VTPVRFVVPAGIDDQAHPSGGNRYDRMLAAELVRAGWDVRLLRVGDGPGSEARDLTEALTALAPEDTVLVDGLLATAAPAVVAAHAPRLRVVILLHMLAPGTGEPPGYPAVLDSAQAVITTSEWTRRRLLDAGYPEQGRVHAAPPGVERAVPVATSPSGSRLRCVAALVPHKGQDVLIDSLSQIRSLDWTCDLVGAADLDPAFTQRLHEQVRTSGMAHRVRFLEPPEASSIRDLYDGADLLVLPSLVESYGMVVTESIACGLPVIAADTGGVAEAMGMVGGRRPGLLVAPGETTALAEALEAWLTGPALRGELTAAALERRRGLPAWEATGAVAARVLASVRDFSPEPLCSP
jgi:glycosyltransferase involved in cell wall biosynthesis